MASRPSSADGSTRKTAGPSSGRARRSEAPRKTRARSSTAAKASRAEPSSAEASRSSRPRNVRLSRKQRAKAEGPPRPALRERSEALARAMAVRLAPLRRPAVWLLRGVGVVVAIAGAIAVGRLVQQHLESAEAFATRSIELNGAERLERDELLDAAGLAVGQNVFEVSPEAAQARLAAHPWIAEAEVTRRLPGRYTLRVREQRAVALLVVETCADDLITSAETTCEEDPGSSLYLVSEEGTVFKRLEGEDPVDMPVITGVPRQRFGTDPEFRSAVLLEAVALLHEYRAAGLWRRMPIAEIHLEPDDGFSLYAGDDLTHVRLGKPPFQTKLRRMRKVLDRLESEEASAAYVYLDNARRPDRVTVRLR